MEFKLSSSRRRNIKKMRKNHHPATSRHHFSVATVIPILAFLLMLSFAGCASGSCLSYGHSCWGAHGKRSNNVVHRSIDAHRDDGPVSEMETDENAPAPRSHDRWILSRLITGRLTVPAPASTAGKRSGNRWYEGRKIIAFPGNWDTHYDSTRTQILRNRNAENAESVENENSIDDAVDVTRTVVEPHAETTELFLLPSGDESDNRPSRKRMIQLLKVLTDGADGKL